MYIIKDIRFTYSHIFIYVHSYIHVFIYSCNIEEDPSRQFGKCMVSPCFSPLVILKNQSVVIITRSLFRVRFPPATRSPNYFYQSSNLLFCFVGCQVMERMSLMGLLGVLSKYIAAEPLAEQLEQAIHRLRPGEAWGP